ncbi:MAG: sugar-transfer associated ATP-grasp domain-containing protein [Bacteroidales bacterium]|nr:sugar-transfer associated ATP-grasp domain-containing protein [Bacteroidales bacterium]
MMKQWMSKILHADKQVVGINRRNLELIYPNNPSDKFYLVDDKAETKILLEQAGIPIPETYTIIGHSWEIDEKFNTVKEKENMVIKPANGAAGHGILIMRKAEEDRWMVSGSREYNPAQIKMHIAAIIYGAYAHDRPDRCIIEERINAHPVIASIFDDGIPDIRIIIYHDKPLMAMLRVPTSFSGGKANLHQGAIGIGIDMDTGTTTGGYYMNRTVEYHPDNGIRLRGIKIPDWNKVKEISLASARLVPLKYLGVDIIIDENKGPLIIEMNARPGLQIQNANLKGLANTIYVK